MAVRASMQQIIDTTRQLIGDVSLPQDFTDQDVQNVLDAHRAEVRYELLHAMPDIQPGSGGGVVAEFVWASYQSEYQYWESDVVVQGVDSGGSGQSWAILTPTTFEYIAGKWTFAVTLPDLSATPPAQLPPVWATGKAYDIFAAAAELLERRIALRSFTMFDFTADGRSMRLGAVLDRWEKLRDTYVGRSWNRVIEIIRSDLAPDDGGTGSGQRTRLLPDVMGAGGDY